MSALRRWLERGWYGRRPRLLLRPLAWVYGIVVAARARMYRQGLFASEHPGVPTIIVGNLSVGGTGKTPLVIWLAARLLEAGRKPGIVLRGYGGRQRAAHLVRRGDDPRRVGDEAVLHVRHSGCPVAVAARRIEAARLLVSGGCDVIIADDGLQHLGLLRDLEIIVVDGVRGLGNGALLPAGPLREKSVWERPGALTVVNGAVRGSTVSTAADRLEMRLEAGLPRLIAGDREGPPDLLRGATVHALAGIGNPRAFFTLLRELGARPIEHPYPDHSHYRSADLTFADGLPVVMTEKDAVKCRALADGRHDLYYLPVTAVLPPADAARLVGRVLEIGRV